ncbi:relaxase domain-containing protein [Aeromicrobium tamlense]|nr:relaxase domain-containing protein [Aeromicrobium tamlense]
MSAGDGYKYLLKSVVAADGNRALSTPMTRYYAEAGTPPGRWMGAGLKALSEGTLSPGEPVTEEQLALLLGAGRDPRTGEKLGLAFPQYASIRDRVASRAATLSAALSPDQRSAALGVIESEEQAHGESRAVAGFDFTFSVPKSVSVLWGVADAGTQARIVEEHHAAVSEVLALLEREVAATRVGRSNGESAVAQVEVVGVAAAAFDHWDSRVGDPQLHTHVVISNKVMTKSDGKWRSLDSRPLHAAVVALSEHYNAVLADRLSRNLGLEWEQRQRGQDRTPAWELALVPDLLVKHFSGRARAIELEKDRLIEDYVAQHGRRPSRTTVIRLRAHATLASRPDKQVRSLADLTEEWRARAGRVLGRDGSAWTRGLLRATRPQPALRADDISLDVISSTAAAVVHTVSEKRSTWRYWNLWAEAARQTMGWRFASAQDREDVTAMIVADAKGQSLALTPAEFAATPAIFTRADGTSQFRPRHGVVYSSVELLGAEDRLLARANDRTAPTLSLGESSRYSLQDESAVSRTERGGDVLRNIASSGRRLDLLVGPAGGGKTTAMRTLRLDWQAQHGRGSVIGLAPSATAAQVLADDLGIACENTAKWLYDHDHGGTELQRGQLVIIDEATLAGTLTLDRITALAAEAGAKVLLVGDWAQLQSVDAGGAFNLLAQNRDDVPELSDVHRFTHEWEKRASLELRRGSDQAIDTYIRHGRVREGATGDMNDAAYLAWRADVRAGRESVLVAESASSVIDLNTRARAERILDGDTSAGRDVLLADGTRASAGDIVITRTNDRRLGQGSGSWVRNGDRWRVASVGRDGSLDVERPSPPGRSAATLPATYVAEHVELGYAVTAHRAQGLTVDTAHVVVSRTTTKESLYVSMTRGRERNAAYVALDCPDDTHAADAGDASARAVMLGVLRHSGAELSAHQVIEAEQRRWSSIAQVAAEYETLAAVAQHDRWVDMLRRSGLADEQVSAIIRAESFGPLSAELRRAEAAGMVLAERLPRIVNRRSLQDAEDIGAVLIDRLAREARVTQPEVPRDEVRFIGGLIPAADGAMPGEIADALAQLQAAIEAQARALAHAALAHGEPWTRRLGPPPVGRQALDRWMHELRIVAAYRDRYPEEVGGRDRTAADVHQRRDRAHAAEASERARSLATSCRPEATGPLSAVRLDAAHP